MPPESHPTAPAGTERVRLPPPMYVGVLEQLTDRCVAVLDVAAAGVLFTAPGGGLRVAAASSPRCQALEMFAAATDTGPCVDALRTGAQISCPHIDRDSAAWPGFAAAARRGGFRAAHALPLRHQGEVIGALSLLDTRAHTLDPDQRALAQTLADDTATALLRDHDHSAPRRPSATRV